VKVAYYDLWQEHERLVVLQREKELLSASRTSPSRGGLAATADRVELLTQPTEPRPRRCGRARRVIRGSAARPTRRHT
jgi:hypothetical protein